MTGENLEYEQQPPSKSILPLTIAVDYSSPFLDDEFEPDERPIPRFPALWKNTKATNSFPLKGILH